MVAPVRSDGHAVLTDRAGRPITVRPLVPEDLAEVMRIDGLQTGGARAGFHERVAAGFLSHGDGKHRIALGVDGDYGEVGFHAT